MINETNILLHTRIIEVEINTMCKDAQNVDLQNFHHLQYKSSKVSMNNYLYGHLRSEIAKVVSWKHKMDPNCKDLSTH